MAERIILNVETPKTQTVESVKAFLKWRGRADDPLPAYVELVGGVRLTRSRKGDAYYTTTSRDCSCPARCYTPGKPCKHMKALQIAMEGESIRPKCGAFRPFSELPSEERAAGVA